MQTKVFSAANDIAVSNPALLRALQQLRFRQSMVKDILTCPQMAMYTNIMKAEQQQPFFAAVTGSAGHHVIYDMHSDPTFGLDADYMAILSRFEKYCKEELDALGSALPNLQARFSDFNQQIADCTNDFMEMLQNYAAYPANRDFTAMAYEQQFVYIVNPYDPPETHFTPEGAMIGKHNPPDFVFTGTIDQVGYYGDGTLAVRDFKFRDKAFRPSKAELDLDIQLTLYAAAIKYGVPACDNCKPRYVQHTDYDPETLAATVFPKLAYGGPCAACTAKIGTAVWPRRFVERCELVWMRDFAKYKKSGKAGTKSYKTGDYKGPCILKTWRSIEDIEVLMGDIVRICDSFRRGNFHRNPGEHCAMWCRHVDLCKSMRAIQAGEVVLTELDYEMPDL